VSRTAKSRWARLQSPRSAVLEKAREASDLTIPGLIPRDGQSDATILQQPYQSLGARGVNNLSSKLMLALFPPGSPFFRYHIDDRLTAGQPKNAVNRIRSLLAGTEVRAALLAETSRPVLWQLMCHLLVAGNVVYYAPRGEPSRLFGLHQFVVRRSPSGKVAELVIKEEVFPESLDPEVLVKANVNPDKAKAGESTVEVYTVIEWSGGKCRWWQELNDVRIGDESSVPEDVSPWIVARWKARPGKHYGESHVMELLGDLMTYEALCKAVTEFAEVASKVIFLDKPNSQTDINELRRARTGDFVQGQLADIDVLQLKKYADFQVVDAVMQRLEQRLAAAFLLQSATIRDAERVTAEEIRAVAQELEDALGGVYTVLASEFQLPFTRRLLHVMQLDGEAPRLNDKAVQPVIVTGFEALGRAHSNNRMRALIGDARNILGDAALQYFDVSTVLSRLAVGYGVENPEEIILSAEDVAQNQQQQQMASALQAAGPQIAKSVLEAGLKDEKAE